jgi:hypothetical protein
MTAALASAEAEILAPAALLPRRPGRIYPRAAKRSAATYPPARRTRPISQHATYTTTVTPPPPATQTPAHQAKQTAQPENRPP